MLTADLVLIVVNVLAYRPFLSQPGSVGYLCAAVAMVLVYGLIVFAATRSPSPPQRRVLRIAAIIGCCLALLEVVNISVETFAVSCPC